jgi:hypothetical protein
MNNLNYVYSHIDPLTGEIMYIGMGTGGRAWASGSSSGTYRDPEHATWLEELFNMGYTMGDISKVLHKQKSRNDAYKIEHELILALKPIFNKIGNPDRNYTRKFTEQQALTAVALHESGVKLCDIPRELGISSSNLSVLGARMLASGNRILNRK